MRNTIKIGQVYFNPTFKGLVRVVALEAESVQFQWLTAPGFESSYWFLHNQVDLHSLTLFLKEFEVATKACQVLYGVSDRLPVGRARIDSTELMWSPWDNLPPCRDRLSKERLRTAYNSIYGISTPTGTNWLINMCGEWSKNEE